MKLFENKPIVTLQQTNVKVLYGIRAVRQRYINSSSSHFRYIKLHCYQEGNGKIELCRRLLNISNTAVCDNLVFVLLLSETKILNAHLIVLHVYFSFSTLTYFLNVSSHDNKFRTAILQNVKRYIINRNTLLNERLYCRKSSFQHQ